jgi:hypothetical protein
LGLTYCLPCAATKERSSTPNISSFSKKDSFGASSLQRREGSATPSFSFYLYFDKNKDKSCLLAPSEQASVAFSPFETPLLLSLLACSEGASKRGGGSFSPLERGNKDIGFISEFKGLFFSNPLLSISLAVSLFSMAGIPPLIGFFSKQLVLYSALQNGYFFISVLAIIVSVISCSYYLQIIKVLFTPSDGHARPSFGDPTATQEAVATLTPPLRVTAVREAATSTMALKPKAAESSESLVLNRSTSSEGAVYKREGSTSSCRSPSPAAGRGNPKVGRDESLPLVSLGGESLQRRGVKNEIHLTNTHSYLISTLTFTILLFFIKPSLILNSTQLLSLSLFYI